MSQNFHHFTAITNLGDIGLPAAVTQVKELFKEESRSQYRIGQLLVYIIDRRLAERGGYASPRELFSVEFKDVKKSTLNLYVSIARNFSADVAQVYGCSKLDRLLRYAKVSKQDIPKEDPGPFVIKVPQRNGPDLDKTFADCTRDEIALATQKLQKPQVKLPIEHADAVNRLHDALLETLGTDTAAALKASTQDGQTFISIEHVAFEELEALLNALLKAKASDTAPQAPSPSQVLSFDPISPVGEMTPGTDPVSAAPKAVRS